MTQPPVTNFIATDRVQPPRARSALATGAPAARARQGAGSRAQAARRRQGAAGRGRAAGRQGGARPPAQLAAAGAAVLLRPSRGVHGTVFVQAADARSGRPAAENRARRRALQHDRAACCAQDMPVKLRVNVQARFLDRIATPTTCSPRCPAPIRAAGSGRDARRAPRLVAHRHGRDRQRRRRRGRDGGVPDPEGARRSAAADAASRALGRRGGRACSARAPGCASICAGEANRPRDRGRRLLQHRSGQGPDLRLVSREQRRRASRSSTRGWRRSRTWAP